MQCCVYIVCVHVVYEMLCIGWYIYCSLNIAYVALGIDGVMYMSDM